VSGGDVERQREHLEWMRYLEDTMRILREVLEGQRSIEERLARIEGRILPPGTN
jgi:hypothetical protein